MKRMSSKVLSTETKRKFIKKCPTCGEDIEKVYLSNGDTFITECRCIERQRELDEINKMANNKKLIIQKNKEQCGFSKRDFENTQTKIILNKGNIDPYNKLIDYANAFNENTSIGFYLFGSPGVGKSFLSKKVMAIVLNHGFSAYITSVTKLMKDIKNEMKVYNDDTFRKCLEVDLLVIDDIGTEKPTDFDKAQMFEIINSRYENKKPIIYTSNLKIDDIKMKYDDFGRIYSRIVGSTIQLTILSPDHRIEVE